MSTLEDFIADLDEKMALSEIRRLIENGVEPKKILAMTQKGLHIVGERFEKKQYALIELEMADLLFRECVNVIETLSGEKYAELNIIDDNMLKKSEMTDLG